MKDLNYHKSNLVSVKSITNQIWEDKIFFKNLLKHFLEDRKHILMIGRLSYLPIKDSFIRNVLELIPKKNVTINEKESNHVSFYYSVDPANDNLHELINDFWIIYEQPALIITDNIEAYLSINLERMSWVDLCSVTESAYVLFRGIEEDVLWVGKSYALKFPDMEKIINFKPTLG